MNFDEYVNQNEYCLSEESRNRIVNAEYKINQYKQEISDNL